MDTLEGVFQNIDKSINALADSITEINERLIKIENRLAEVQNNNRYVQIQPGTKFEVHPK